MTKPKVEGPLHSVTHNVDTRRILMKQLVLAAQTGNPQKEIQIANKQMKRCLISLLIKEMHMQREVYFPLPR